MRAAWPGRTSGRTRADCCASALAELPVEVDVDEAGNLWARLAGERPETVVIGSHVDSVPNGGWLDGALGVMGALETLRSLAEAGTPPCTVTLVDWADEEGARFGRSLLGSSAVAGTLDPGHGARPARRERRAARGCARGARRRARSRAGGGQPPAGRARLPRAAHRAGARARGPRPPRRNGARHRRRGAQPRDLPRTGRARRLDAHDPPARLVPRGRALRARGARRGSPSRRDDDHGRRDIAARRDHGDRRRDGLAARPAAPRRGHAGGVAGRVAGARRRGGRGRALHRRVGADLAHRADPLRPRPDRCGPRGLPGRRRQRSHAAVRPAARRCRDGAPRARRS